MSATSKKLPTEIGQIVPEAAVTTLAELYVACDHNY